MEKRFHYGGQAVIEGVMMRGRKNVAIAVRRPDGEIVLSARELGSLYTGRPREWPLVRGAIVLVETLVLGMKALMYSTNVALEREGEENSALLWGTAAFGMVFALALFLVLPLLLTRYLVDPHIDSAVVSNLADGILRLVIFLLYLKVIALMPDIRRVWAYHGAEHKTINAYEAGIPLEVEAVRPYSTAHTRCGTGFILIVLVLAILVFAFTGQPALWVRLLTRLALLPLIAAASYEMIRFCANHTGNRIVRAVTRPSLALQALTTREPDEQQLEVAISALNKALEGDGVTLPQGSAP